MKICSRCGEAKDLSEYYSIEKESKIKGKYTYHFPYCKKCQIEKTLKERDVNRVNELSKHYYRTREKTRENRRNIMRKRRKEGKFQEWQKNNRDKLKDYALKRKQKEHEISNEEWNGCKEYFNNSCSYCGIGELEAKEKYKNKLHRDHVDHNGANDLSNCVPACKSCNGFKHTFELEEWFNENNPNFTYERINKIIKWLEGDYKNFMKKED